jgi:3-deoxy-7-phosphoheptulonate synthase
METLTTVEPMTRNDLLTQNKPLIIAGPCAIESQEQLMAIAVALAGLGVPVLRANPWKPRTTPDTFQGMGEEAIPWIIAAKEATGMLVASEVMHDSQIELLSGISDILWVGARNMQNYDLLRALGKDPEQRPIILKNGLIATVDEWIGAAKYIDLDRVILCERGIRTGVDALRFTPNIPAMLVAQHIRKMPVIADPSHAAGKREFVGPLALSAIAAGAQGLIIEVHNNPEVALSDAAQQLTIPDFAKLLGKVHQIYDIVH